DHDLADLALRNLVAVVVDDLHLDPVDRRADRPRLTIAVRVIERGDGRGLRQAVSLEHLAAERLLNAAQQLDWHRGPAGYAQLQRRDVIAITVGKVEHRS